MIKPSVQLQEQENMSESRILFEEVMIDNQPTQQQVVQRAQQLEIDDLNLARESLTKQLEPFWRPYMNRYGDIYYVNLKDRKAYVDHPIDMETKILYSKRHKTLPPKFRSFEFQDISNSVHLIEEEIKKWKKTELLRSTQTIPSQLNVVYEESQEQNTERQKSEENDEHSDDQYIENLQKSQEENTRSRRSTPREQKESFNIGYKKFPSLDVNQNDNNFEEESDDIDLTPEYERMLIEYQAQLKRQHQKQLQVYREQKQQNYMKKQEIYRQTLKAKIDQYKFNVLKQFESQIEEKNSHNFDKETHKMIMEYKQKLKDFQTMLQRQKINLQKLQQADESKQNFIQSLESKMQYRINQGKYLMSETIRKQMYQNHFVIKINEINEKSKDDYSKESYQIIGSKLNQLIKQKGVRENLKGQIVYSSSLTSFYENMLKKQFEKIDKLLLQNEISRQMRKRTKSIFNKAAMPEHPQSHIIFAQSEREMQQENKQKQNNFNDQNITLKNKSKIIEQIEKDILKSTQINIKYYQRRNKIFGNSDLSMIQKHNFTNVKEESKDKIDKQEKSQQVPAKFNVPFGPAIRCMPDRKSMYLRMMKRIL